MYCLIPIPSYKALSTARLSYYSYIRDIGTPISPSTTFVRWGEAYCRLESLPDQLIRELLIDTQLQRCSDQERGATKNEAKEGEVRALWAADYGAFEMHLALATLPMRANGIIYTLCTRCPAFLVSHGGRPWPRLKLSYRYCRCVDAPAFSAPHAA